MSIIEKVIIVFIATFLCILVYNIASLAAPKEYTCIDNVRYFKSSGGWVQVWPLTICNAQVNH